MTNYKHNISPSTKQLAHHAKRMKKRGRRRVTRQVRMGDLLHTKLTALAKLEKKTLSKIVDMCVRFYLRNNKSVNKEINKYLEAKKKAKITDNGLLKDYSPDDAINEHAN